MNHFYFNETLEGKFIRFSFFKYLGFEFSKLPSVNITFKAAQHSGKKKENQEALEL